MNGRTVGSYQILEELGSSSLVAIGLARSKPSEEGLWT
jgi:hypothetical protein